MKKTQLKYFLSPSFLVILVLNACAPGTPIPTPKPTGVRFESAACMFGELNGVDCGYLYVPEDHTQPKGTELQLAVAIIRSSNPNRIHEFLYVMIHFFPFAVDVVVFSKINRTSELPKALTLCVLIGPIDSRTF